MREALAALALLAAILAVGCQKNDKPATGEASAARSESAPTSAPATGDRIGIEICDRYLSRSARCIEAMPADERATERERLTRVEADWRQQAAEPGARQRLETRCDKLYQAALTVADRLCPGVY